MINGRIRPAGPRHLLHRNSSYHRAVADLLDPFTQWRITGLEPNLTGARVLEVGPGHGGIAWWLAEQVGDTGQVVAVDPDPSHLPHHRQITPVGHDLTTGTVPVNGPFDLIHIRLTLAHLPNRRHLLTLLANLLGPGGTLLVQDGASRGRGVVVQAPNPAQQQLFERYHQAAGKALEASGTDLTWATRLHPHLLEERLVEVDTVVHWQHWHAGHPGLRVVAAMSEQLRPQLARYGFGPAQVGRLQALLIDPMLIVRGWPLYSTSGRRPT